MTDQGAAQPGDSLDQTLEPEGLTRAAINRYLAKLEEYDFECEAGPLRNCLEWYALKQLLAQLLTDDVGITIVVQLLADVQHPKVEALCLLGPDGSASYRFAGGKATGAWNVKREFQGSFTVGQLREHARTIRQPNG